MRISPLPPLQCLVAFESAVRHGSFTKAAAELYLTQSAISRQIAQLETFLGCSLFVRDHLKLGLTIAGKRYAEQVQGLLTNCAEATFDIMKQEGNLDLTVACSSGIATLWLIPRLGSFRAAHPNVKLRLVVREMVAALRPAELDVGLYSMSQAVDPHYTAHRIFDEEAFPVCSPRYLAGRLIAPAELAGKTLLVLEDVQRQWVSWADWFRRNGVEMPKQADTIRVNLYPQLLELAILDQGVAIGWRYIIDGCLKKGLLVRAARESASNGGGFFLVVPNDRTQSAAVRLFTRWLFSQAKQSLSDSNI